jgi:TonB family protein
MSEKQYGILGTFILHNIIVLILLFTYISLSKPVLSEGGILINFGDAESAGGQYEPAMNNQSAAAASAPQQPAETEDGLMTQDFEEAPAVRKPETVKKPEKKPESRPVQESVSPEPKKPTVNTRALYSSKGKSTTESGSSEGIYKGSGNMGDPTGTTESDNYAKGLGGGGPVANLNGRYPLDLKKPDFNIQRDGTVVVEISVDRTGTVISAAPGAKGSTLVDKTLYAAARKAALESKFNRKDDADERQIGTITYHFKLQ